METVFNLFDSLLSLVVSFPVTIYYALLSTDKLADPESAALIVSPGTTLVISFLIWYTAITLEIRIKYELDLPDLPSKSFLGKALLILIMVLLIQYFYLVLAYFGSPGAEETLGIIKALSYPSSVFMTIYSIVYALYLLFPLGSNPRGFSFKERLESSFREVRRESASKRIVVEENAEQLAFIAGSLAYSFALYKMLRSFYGMFAETALLHTAGLIVIPLFVLVIILVLVHDRLSNLIEQLRSELTTMPDDNH